MNQKAFLIHEFLTVFLPINVSVFFIKSKVPPEKRENRVKIVTLAVSFFNTLRLLQYSRYKFAFFFSFITIFNNLQTL